MAGRTLWVANFDFEERCLAEWDRRKPSPAMLPEKYSAINRRFATAISEVVPVGDRVITPRADGRIEIPDDNSRDGCRAFERLRFWGVNRWAHDLADRHGFSPPEFWPGAAEIVNHRLWGWNRHRRRIDAGLPITHYAGTTCVTGTTYVEAVRRDCEFIESQGYRGWIIKPGLGAAGRGFIFGSAGAFDEAIAARIENLAARTAFVVEPWLELTDEVSLHFTIEGPGAWRFDGVVPNVCDDRGRYRENGRPLTPDATGKWLPARDEVIDTVVRAAAEEGYHGPLGVDSAFYRDGDGAERLRPVLDINARMTMGRLAIKKADPSFDL